MTSCCTRCKATTWTAAAAWSRSPLNCSATAATTWPWKPPSAASASNPASAPSPGPPPSPNPPSWPPPKNKPSPDDWSPVLASASMPPPASRPRRDGRRVAGLPGGSALRRDQRCCAWSCGKRGSELVAGADAELGEDFPQVVGDGGRAEEQLGGDLGVGEAAAGQAGDLGLLGGERVARFDGALMGRLTGGRQLAAGTLGERLHAGSSEHVMGDAELRARVGPAALAAQPLPVQQVRPSKLGTKARAVQPVDRLAIGVLRVLAVAEQRPAACVYPQPPVGLADARRLGQPLERVGGQLILPRPAGRLDQLRERPHGHKQFRRLLAGLLGLGQGLLVAAQTVVEDSRCQLAPLDPRALPGNSRVHPDRLDKLA